MGGKNATGSGGRTAIGSDGGTEKAADGETGEGTGGKTGRYAVSAVEAAVPTIKISGRILILSGDSAAVTKLVLPL